MRNATSFLNLKTVILLFVVLFVFQSCEKRTTEDTNCLAFLTPDTLRFNIVDKNTGENLFFSNTPFYTIEQVYFLIDDMATHVKPRVETSTSLGTFLYIAVGTGVKNGKIKVYIDNELEYNIDYSMKVDKSSECPQYIFDEIVINGNQQERDIKDRVILMKK